MPKFWKGHNSGNIWRNWRSKVNLVIYSSFPVSWPSFKTLAQILFEISCWQDFIIIFSKRHNSRKGDNSDKKNIWVSYFSMRNPYMKFQNPSMHGSYWHASKSLMDAQPESNMPPQFLEVGGINRESPFCTGFVTVINIFPVVCLIFPFLFPSLGSAWLQY